MYNKTRNRSVITVKCEEGKWCIVSIPIVLRCEEEEEEAMSPGPVVEAAADQQLPSADEILKTIHEHNLVFLFPFCFRRFPSFLVLVFSLFIVWSFSHQENDAPVVEDVKDDDKDEDDDDDDDEDDDDDKEDSAQGC